MHKDSRQSALEAQFLAHRARLLRFLAARGAGEAAEDVLHDVWLRIAAAPPVEIDLPLAYLMRTANRVMIDRYRSQSQATRRDQAWGAAQPGGNSGVSQTPSAHRLLVARQHTRMVAEALDALGERPAAVFRRHRMDEVPQRAVAEEFGVSLSTVESDLRNAYRALAELKERIDEV